MRPFAYARADSAESAVRALSEAGPGVKVLAGGTTLYDLMKLDIEAPTSVVDVHRVPELSYIDTSGDELVFGAGARMADMAEDPVVRNEYPMLSESLWRAASEQLRIMATAGGNLLQRTRCAYFRGGEPYACNKRNPGSGCAAIGGADRGNALFGISDSCAAVYPGDWPIALIALDTEVDILGPDGERTIPLAELHREPGDRPEVETTLRPDELILRIRVRKTPAGRGSAYVKVRDRESYAFALASAAVAVAVEPTGVVTDARIGIGGVATRPWRVPAAEQALIGQPLTPESMRHAGEVAYQGARPGTHNVFKVELGIRVVADALRIAGERAAR
ncbi:xanthine dehydrogenase family protein subunit M [Actinocrispum sp. NPDC049592]|uniref:FAD binding domain-containing protein n=1 Tax=Actinocrispum sp. NPDC049592 TaxID=3154835 RepID=UPI00342066E5